MRSARSPMSAASTSARRVAMRRWRSATCSSYLRLLVVRPPSWLKTTIIGDRAIVISMYGLLVNAYMASPMMIGARMGTADIRVFSGFVGTLPRAPNGRSPTTTGL